MKTKHVNDLVCFYFKVELWLCHCSTCM